MTALRDEVDETVGLHELLPTGERVVVDQVECHQELRRHYTDIGIPIPLPHGAPGKAMLSDAPLEPAGGRARAADLGRSPRAP